MASWKNVQYKNGQYRTSEGGGGSSTLSGLDDVTISSASNGQVLKYNSTSSKWVNANDTSVTALEDLTDVDIDTKSDGDVLTYNQAQDRWEAAEPLGGGVTDVEVDGVSVVNDGVAEITTPNAGGIDYDNQQSGLLATDVQSAIDELSQGTSVGTLSDLTDTAISSPSNNQVLTYDSTTSKWKNANATGGASSLNDLTDVDTTGVLDNNFLAYSSGQSKWVPATVSGGNVDDVQVNGTSVVTNKVAQIKSYKEVTLQQYQQLPSSKTSDGVLYCITDAGGADGFPPLIYSDEEREVGVWRDGKPLYQKTFTWTGTYTGTENNLDISLDHPDYVFIKNGSGILSGGQYIPLPYSNPNMTSPIGVFVNSTKDKLALRIGSENTLNKIIITICYTKTTDVAGSGTWTTDGRYAHHYSTTEQIIGTWIDGKTLYEKTLKIYNDSAFSNGTYFSSTINNPAFVMVKEAYYSDTPNNGVGMLPYHQFDGGDAIVSVRWNPSNNNLYLRTTSNFSVNSARFLIIVLQYTKNTD